MKKKIEKLLKLNKVIGLDLVLFKDFKFFGVFFIYSLLLVFKKSIDDIVFLINWKFLCVKLVLKKGVFIDMSNFRFIFFLSILGKIFEDIISDSIDNYIEV